MRGILLAILLAGCMGTDLAVEPGQATGTDPAFPDVALTVDVESTDRFWANATIRNDGDVVTLLGTPPKGCAPSFSFTLYQGERVVERIPEAICEL